MTYVPRTYEEIVRDMLTTLTGGTVREVVTAPADDSPILLEKLRNRPVRRISHLEGMITVGTGEQTRDIPYKFTLADFELVSTGGNENEKDSIRFREGGRRPKPGTKLSVNYYPVQTDPTPLTDLNVGSVIRTIIETCAREMVMGYLGLDHIYKSAYLETAENSSLDKVVALVGVRRLPAGYPVVKLEFSRRTGTLTQVTVPANTAVTDAAGNRYLTLEPLTLEPGESTREVQARGERPTTRLVEQNTLNRMEIIIAGIDQVTNPQPARTLSAPETDDELRRRASRGLHGVVRGTVDALKFGLMSIEGVKAVNIIEAPNAIPGEIGIEIAYNAEDPSVEAKALAAIEELRPAGIRVLPPHKAGRKRLTVQVRLTLAGTGLPGGEISALNESVQQRLKKYLTDLPPGGKARRAQMMKLVLDDSRITDAEVKLLADGEAPQDELELPADTVLDVVGFTFLPPTYDAAGPVPAITSIVSAMLPVHLVAGVTLAQASNAITLALNTYLAGRRSDAPLTVDGLAAAIRDDTRFALVRKDVIVTVESGGRFIQLTDGVGAYAPGPNETLQKGQVNIEPREGGI